MEYKKKQVNEINLVNEIKIDLGFYPRRFTGLSLPIHKPKTFFYEISNGNFLMYLASGSWVNPKTQKQEHLGLPYGIYPRHILIFICQEYHRNKTEKRDPKIIDIPATMPAFLDKLGYKRGGLTYKVIYNQMHKLLNTGIVVEQKIERNGKKIIFNKENRFAEEYALWWDVKRPNQESLFECKIKLSDLTLPLIKRSIPLNLETIRKIGDRKIEFDYYCWLNARHYEGMKHPYTISWKKLMQQFGLHYKDTRRFKHIMKKVAANIRELYFHNSKLTEHGILLQNSKPDIEPINRSIRKSNLIKIAIKSSKKVYKQELWGGFD